MFSKNIANITRWQLNICTPVQSIFRQTFIKLGFIKIPVHMILKLNVDSVTEKKVFRASNEKIGIRQGIRSFVPCIVKGINNHMFQSTQMGLPGFIRCWLLALWPRPGLKAWLCFHLTRHYHNHIFTSDFLHLNISPWHATEAELTRQVKRKFCFQRRDPILFIFSPPQSFYSFDRFSKDLVKS